MSKTIYHLANPEDYDELQQNGTYSAPSLASEGFIHCCSSEQLPGVIQRYYIDADKLIVLHIDAERLSAELVYENTSGGTELFAHIYGQINASAVLDTAIIERPAIAQIASSEQY